MSELGSAVAAAVATQVGQLSDEQLREDLVGFPQQLAALKAAWLTRVRELERRQLHQDDGMRSAGAWLRAHTLASGREGASSAWFARRLSRLPLTFEAFAAGEISEAHARQIARLANDVAADTMRDGEDSIVEAARSLDILQFRGLIDRLRTQWLPEQVGKEADEAYGRRRLDFGEQFAGLVPVDGMLDPVTAEKLQTVVNALAQPEGKDVPPEARRTAAQRRHDALDEALSRMLDAGELPTVRRERPHVNLTVDLSDLVRGTGVGTLDWSGDVHIETARMLTCDARISTLLTSGRGWRPLEILEDHQEPSRKLYRLVMRRDQGCRFPGCDMPAVWSDAHHIVWWSQGGRTSLSNLCMLCRYHHRLIHAADNAWVVEGDPGGTLRFTSPKRQVHLSPVPDELPLTLRR